MSIADKRAQITANNAAILESVQSVYDAGRAAGMAESDAQESYNLGYTTGLAEGKQAEYDTFWDAFQKNGTLTQYNYTFAGTGWDDTTFKPKYDIRPTYQAHNMFNSTSISDVAGCLERAGVCLDLTKVDGGRIDCMFAFSSKITHVPELDVRYAYYASGELNNMFNGCTKLHTIDKIILKDDGSTKPGSSTFANCSKLENIIFEGVIGTTGWNFNPCPLSVASMKNIISHLKNLTGTDGEGVYTLKFNSTCWDALEVDSTAPDGGTWKDYVMYTLGWSV